MNAPLNRSESYVLGLLIDYIAEEGIPPTYNDIERVGQMTRAYAHHCVQGLIAKGYVRKDERQFSRNLWPIMDEDGDSISPAKAIDPEDAEFLSEVAFALHGCVTTLIAAAMQLPGGDTRNSCLTMARVARTMFDTYGFDAYLQRGDDG